MTRALRLGLLVGWVFIQMPPMDVAPYLASLPSYWALQAKVTCAPRATQAKDFTCYVWLPEGAEEFRKK